jgi:tyrosyl-tRNA synthetase
VTIALSPEQEARYERITRNLQEVTSGDIIRKVLAEGETPRAYWGTATTGRPHIAYCVPLMKIADFLNAGVHVKILLADVHAFLDASKSSMESLKHRVPYYSHLLHAVFTTLGVPTDKLEFVTGSSYQLTPEYTFDMYKWVFGVRV